MNPAPPSFELSLTHFAVGLATAAAGVQICRDCVVRNPNGTGFGGGAVEAEIVDAQPGDELRLAQGGDIESDGASVRHRGRVIGSHIRSHALPYVFAVRLEPNTYYDSVSTLLRALEFVTTTIEPGGRRFEIRVTSAEGLTARAEVALDLAAATETKLCDPSTSVRQPVEGVRRSVREGGICALIARMRSGTTAFRQVLSTHPKVSALGEIFHNDSIEDRNYFYNYYLKAVQSDPTLALPSEQSRLRVFTEYLDYLRENLGLADGSGRILIVGINYNSLHSLNSYWQHPFSPPYIFQALRKSGISVIHMRRENLLRTLVSERRARLSGVWHLRSSGEQPTTAIELNTRTLLLELEERQFEIDFMEKCLYRYPRVLHLTYEESFQSDNTINNSVLERCAEFLGLQNEFNAATPFRPTAPPTLREAISNYEDVAQLLSGTRFAEYLHEAGSVS